jgi:hypothetical protein
VSAVAAGLVASSTAKTNAANAAAASVAAAESNAAMQNMQQEMAAQMQQMQQQMAQSAAQQQMAMEQALAETRAQLADAQAANNQEPGTRNQEPGTSNQEPVTSPEYADALAREQAAGQVMAKLDNVTAAMNNVQAALQNVLDYAGCDAGAFDCTGPHRVAAFKQKANAFFGPYEDAVSELYDALITAQALGADISDTYMLLSDGCNSWGEYLCERTGGTNENPIYADIKNPDGSPNPKCRINRILADRQQVMDVMLDNDEGASGRRRVACASDNMGGIFNILSKRNSTMDLDVLRMWINQDAKMTYNNGVRGYDVGACSSGEMGVYDMLNELNETVQSRTRNNICTTRLQEVPVTSRAADAIDWYYNENREQIERDLAQQTQELKEQTNSTEYLMNLYDRVKLDLPNG